MQLNNPFGDNYPFIGPPMDDPSAPKVVYDAYITYYVPDLEYKLPLRLVHIHPRSRSQIKIVDADNTVVFNSRVSTSTWGEDYTIYQGHVDGVSVSIITKGSSSYEPDHGELCLRCIYTQPKHVTSIVVDDANLGHNVDIDYGYNIEYSLEKDTDNVLRPANLVTIDATPGAGLGLVPTDCTTTISPSITSINGVTPDDNGTIYISGDKATKFIQVDRFGTQVSDDTTPCCLCADFSYLGKRLDKHIHKSYIIGAKAEAARDSLKELLEFLSCGNIDIVLCNKFYPVRVYIDTTWPRHAIITTEFRNIIPAIVRGLRVHVDVTASASLEDKTPLRSFISDVVVQGKPPIDAQDYDQGSIVSFSGNSWDINWSADDLAPGFTVWSSVRVRLGNACYSDGGSISATATATFTVHATGCLDDKCLEGIELNIVKTDTKHGYVKGGYGWNDPSGKPQDAPTYGSDGALSCIRKRVFEICEEEHPKE